MDAKNMAITPRIVALLLMASLGACVEGKPIPKATERIKIPAGFVQLGGGTPQCDGAGKTPFERCDVGFGSNDRELYAEHVSWVARVKHSEEEFFIDAHEVTNEQYAYCVELGKCTAPAYQETTDVAGYYTDAPYGNYPVVWVGWQQAMDYCEAQGGTLPTETQWERAARQDTARTFPWGDDVPTCKSIVDPDYVGEKECNLALKQRGPMKVGHSLKDRTPLGVQDLASNVKEWTRTTWFTWAYCQENKACPIGSSGCAEACAKQWGICPEAQSYRTIPDSPAEHVVRGGSYKGTPCDHRLFVRRRETTARADLGFRCVYSEPY